jgi:hydroxymethylglutaryl-CoA reductase (NADPH)
MSASSEFVKQIRENILKIGTIEELAERLRARPIEKSPLEINLPSGRETAENGPGFLVEALRRQGKDLPIVTGRKAMDFGAETYARNIENYIGLCSIPVGVAGPLRINGLNAHGDFVIPLATTEAALVASFHRGCKALTLSGGVTSTCIVDKMGRAPIFVFRDMSDALRFCAWIVTVKDRMQAVAEGTSRFAKLVEYHLSLNGQDVVLHLEFTTGDASGQNMVTLASDAACKFIVEACPVPIVRWYIESNMSGDKKATALAFIQTRGKRVTAEARVPAKICESVLKVRPEAIYEAWKISMVSSLKSGAIGSQSHFANGLTALYMATGQDTACIAEAAVGMTQYSIDENGALLVSVCLPNLVVGTVGGGTGLPTQRECLELIGCSGVGKAKKFAEICAALTIAGEISITAAISAGHFTEAHRSLARGTARNTSGTSGGSGAVAGKSRLELIGQADFTRAGKALLGSHWEDGQDAYETYWLGDASPQRAQGDLFLLGWMSEGAATARMAVWKPRTGDPMFMAYARAQGMAASETQDFLAAAKAFARERGIAELMGPMQFSTWHPYRFIRDMGAAPFYSGEQRVPSAYHGDFLAAGFSDIAEYQTTLVEDLAKSIGIGLAMGVDKGLAAVEIKTYEGSELPALLPELYRMSCEIFRGNFAYAELPYEDFLRLAAGDKPGKVALIMASAEGKPAGFAFSYDIGGYSPGPGREARPTSVLKTLGVAPALRSKGLGYALSYLTHKYWLERGHTQILHAYMKTDNHSRSMSSHFGESLRTYALLKGAV